jgi:hypothetical protein
MNKLAFLILLLTSVSWADGDQIVIDGGVGVFHSADHGLSEMKIFTLGVQETLWGPLKDRAVVGGWIDNVSGRSGSGLVSGQIGWEVNSNGLVGSIFTGPAIITSPDNVLLGGYFEFMDDLHLGLQDRNGSYIGVMYRHISDAGLTPINIGRDMICVELRF